MRPRIFSPFLLGLTTLLSLSTLLQAQSDGVFARFETSAGTLRARLAAEQTPLAVSNFVGLVEGSQVSIDTETARLITGNFYNGHSLHSSQPSLVSLAKASGEPLPEATYILNREPHPDLSHETPFILSMVGVSPGKVSGSHFVISIEPSPELDATHTPFGEIVEGQEILSALAAEAANGSPSPVIIENIAIERQGAVGQAFQPDLGGLPSVSLVPVEWQSVNAGFQLRTAFREGAAYQLYNSPDLLHWSRESVHGKDDPLPEDQSVDVGDLIEAAPVGFFKLAEVFYPTIILPPSSLSGKTLDATITQWDTTTTNSKVSYTFSGTTSGSATLGSGAPIGFRNHSYEVDSPTRATLIVPSELSRPFDLPQFALSFLTETAGTFIANLPTHLPAPIVIAGTFLLQ